MCTRSLKTLISCYILTFLLQQKSFSQDLSSAGNYMDYFKTKTQLVNQTYINYLSAVSHGKSARKVEKLRNKVVELIYNTRNDVAGTPPFKGEKSLRDAVAAYFKTCYIVFNEDYAKIVDMEEIAEQSFDAMEAYMLAQEKANEKLAEASKKSDAVYEQFAASHNITLVKSTDALEQKMEKASRVHKYFKPVNLMVFKCNKQDGYLTEAINAGNINGIEQNRNALANYAEEGIKQLAEIKAFDGDGSLIIATGNLLRFYKNMAKKETEHIAAFYIASEQFNKTKKEFESKPAKQRTKVDIDTYNKAVNDINTASNEFNKVNKEINRDRSEYLTQWDKTVSKFLDNHMPYARK